MSDAATYSTPEAAPAASDAHLAGSRGAFEPFQGSDLLLRVPVGFASPLWGLFAGAAISGSAWWWMTRFARIENLEAMFGAAENQAVKAAAAPLPAVEAAVGAALETLGAVEAAVETVIEPTIETVENTAAGLVDEAVEDVLAATAPAPIPAAETLIDASPEPVGGESAPISPMVAAFAPEIAAEPEAAAPEAAGESSAKPRRKIAPPKAD